ncbi:hypothetical protein PENTCL1PPCAC_149, partial [Pristionchus entomophagus]
RCFFSSCRTNNDSLSMFPSRDISVVNRSYGARILAVSCRRRTSESDTFRLPCPSRVAFTAGICFNAAEIILSSLPYLVSTEFVTVMGLRLDSSHA